MAKKPSAVTSIRFTPELADAVERCVEQERRAHPGQKVRRADVIRALLVDALQARKIPIERAN